MVPVGAFLCGLALPGLVRLVRTEPGGVRASSSPASRRRPGPTTGPRGPGTTTGSTGSSRTSISATPGSATRSRRSRRSGCGSGWPGSGWMRCRSSSRAPIRTAAWAIRTSDTSPNCASTSSGSAATPAAGRGERRPRPAHHLLRRQRRLGQPAAHAVRLPAQRPDHAGARPPGPRTGHRGATRHPAAARRITMGHVPAQPRRGRPVPAHRRPAAGGLRRVRSAGGHAPIRAGNRRRLAPMLGGDQRRIRLAYSLQFTLRGTPVIRYGEEIGMGDDLSLPDREANRTPMQWSQLPNAGFSTAAPGQLVCPVVTDGTFGYGTVNVRAQRNDPGSLLSWFEQMMRTLRECPEIKTGSCTHVDVPVPPGVLAHRADDTTGTILSCTTSTTRTPPSTSAASPTSPDRPRRCSPTATTATSTWLSSRSAATATAGSACAENWPRRPRRRINAPGKLSRARRRPPPLRQMAARKRPGTGRESAALRL